MMSNSELEAAVLAIVAFEDTNANSILSLAEGSSRMALTMIQYKTKLGALERKLEEAFERIEALENKAKEVKA